jgi:transcriptional regulator
VYIPKAFAVEDRAMATAFMRAHSFATLVSNAPELIATHVPLLIKEAEDGALSLHFHLARANEHWQAFDGVQETLVIFQGPHGYVSPSLYAHHPSVPTWSYQAVHAYGPASVLTAQEARQHVLELIAYNEAGRQEPWTPQLPEDYFQGRLADVVAARIDVLRIEAKFKVSQNRPRDDREAVAASFESSLDPMLRALGDATRSALR